MTGPRPAFRGRARERAVLDELLDRVRLGQGAALVIRGEAGIGKTALMHYCARRASGSRVVQIAGVPAESHMPFAALHQLCEPFLDHRGRLPAPQQHALQVTFGVETGVAPDRFVLGLGVLGLLAEVSRQRPLVCLVDDAQWLDEPSLQVLGFVARRLMADPILVLLALRQGEEERLLPTLPTMTLGGLTDDDARRLLAGAVPGRVDEQVRDRIVAETRGNPRLLLELSRQMSAAELSGGFSGVGGSGGGSSPGGVQAVAAATSSAAAQLKDHFSRLIATLPEPTRRFLLLAAADPTGDASLLWRAAPQLGLSPGAALAAESLQLLEIDDQVRFRHPMVRSAAYAGAAEDQRAAHRALAAATDAQRPDRRVWHLAAAAGGPDDDVAAQLVQMACMAHARAGLAAAAAFLGRAAALTASPLQRADRALVATEAHLEAGDLRAARTSLAWAAAAAAGDLQLARIEQLSGRIDADATPGPQASVKLLKAGKRLESLDPRLARDAYLQAWWAALRAGRFAAPHGDLRTVARAVLATPAGPEARPVDLLLDGLAAVVVHDRSVAASTLRLGLDRIRRDDISTTDWVQWAQTAMSAAWAIWDVEAWLELSARQVEVARSSGALASLVAALNFHVIGATCCGDLTAAEALLGELDGVSEATRIPVATFGAHLLAAYQGRSIPDVSQRSATARQLMARGDGYALEVSGWAAAILNNGLGRYPDALAAAHAIADDLVLLTPMALSELIEAAVRTGRRNIAREAQQRLATMTVPGSDWAAGLAARTRALVADPEAAERWYVESVNCFIRTPLRIDLARSHLVYGEWLRRIGRLSDARRQLASAHDMFAAMGAGAFAARARRELLAAGAKATSKARDSAGNELTPQEEHIARLAAEGRTNAEISTELFVSVRTVEWHLHKIFMKLGIASRRDLRRASTPRPHTPAWRPPGSTTGALDRAEPAFWEATNSVQPEELSWPRTPHTAPPGPAP